jgi:hypothetical protein
MIKKYEGILAIDPGVKNCGWAIIREGNLQACGLLRETNENFVDNIGSMCNTLSNVWEEHISGTKMPQYMVIERMKIYNVSKGDPNDLIPLSILAGSLWTTMKPLAVSFPTAPEWKGSVPKDVLIERVRKNFSQTELAILQNDIETLPKSLIHNVYDAVCLGKWAASRIK